MSSESRAPGKTLESEVADPAPGGRGSTAASDGLALVLCTAPPGKAEAVARAVLERRLAACVNILPGVVSLYWWKGNLEKDGESLLLMKTRHALLAALTRAVQGVHPYSVPEVIALGIAPDAGNPAYHAWVRAETEASAEGVP